MQRTHNSQRIPIICQFYDYLNRVNIIFHLEKILRFTLNLILTSLTYHLDPCLDNVRLKSEIQKIICKGRKYIWVCRRNPIVWRRITLEDLRWFRTWKYHLFPSCCSLDSACPIKRCIIKFKCHNIQSTDSDLGPISTLENSEFRRKETKNIYSIKRFLNRQNG